MSRKPETEQEQQIYKDRYFAARGLNLDHDTAVDQARTVMLKHRLKENLAKRDRKRVVTARTASDGRPAGMSDEDWNYGCTPGQFIQDDEKA